MDRNLSRQLLNDMRIGWNLGNTLDAPASETSWGNPETTPEMIKAVKDLGFNTVRLPVSWHRHMDVNHKIDETFMSRVEEIIRWVLDEGMFAILNVHHDDHELQPTDEGAERGKKYLSDVWMQICERFGECGDRLIFEGMNEPRMLRDANEWHLDMSDEKCRRAAEYINLFNQTFVDTVRSSGGKNSERLLMAPPYAAGPAHAFTSEFKVPRDPAEKVIVSIHAYDPQGLALMHDSDKTEFNEYAKMTLDYIFGQAYEKFVKNNIPVIIGEMGIVDKNNPSDRFEWSKYFVKKAREKEILSVWWDNGGRDFKLLNRRTLKVYDDARCVLDGLMEGLSDGDRLDRGFSE